jgi:hypothetical protein
MKLIGENEMDQWVGPAILPNEGSCMLTIPIVTALPKAARFNADDILSEPRLLSESRVGFGQPESTGSLSVLSQDDLHSV